MSTAINPDQPGGRPPRPPWFKITMSIIGGLFGLLILTVVLGAIFGGDDTSEDNAVTTAKSSSESAQPTETAPETSAPPPATTAPSKPKPAAKPRVRLYEVTRVVDGDTIEVASGATIRVVGIDTPERGQCGYDEASRNMEALVLGKRVKLTISDEDQDRYGRLLRYVNVGSMDAGLRQVKRGFAIARYDSRDGYGYHPREERYIAADEASKDFTCPQPKPRPNPESGGSGGGCAPGYEPCLPITDDLNCSDVDGPVTVTGEDQYGLDRDGDGTGCDS